MKQILVVGPISHHHICNFVRQLKACKPDYTLFGLDIMGNKQVDTPFDKAVFVENNSYSNLFSRLHSFIKLLAAFNSFFKSYKIDLVQFQYVNKSTFPLCLLAKFHNAKVNCFVWGSDYLRANASLRRSLKKAFVLADSVVADSDHLVSSLRLNYPRQKGKISRISFGSVIVDKIYDSHQEKRFFHDALGLDSSYDSIIMCGYNASPAQNHHIIIDAIKKQKGNNLWLFPMTYGDKDGYLEAIKKELSTLSCDYIILDSFVEDDKWVYYIKTTDIFIHIQESDSFSSTLAEQLISGNIIINGKWLEYNELIEKGIYYLTTSKDDLANVLRDAISQKTELLQKCKDNILPIYREKSLRATIESNWIPLFESL